MIAHAGVQCVAHEIHPPGVVGFLGTHPVVDVDIWAGIF